MKMHDFDNSYDEAIKSLKQLNSTAEDSIIYMCYVYIYAASGEFCFTIGQRTSIVGTNDTCVRVKSYIDDELKDIEVIDIASVAAIRYVFVRTKKK